MKRLLLLTCLFLPACTTKVEPTRVEHIHKIELSGPLENMPAPDDRYAKVGRLLKTIEECNKRGDTEQAARCQKELDVLMKDLKDHPP